MTTPSTTLYLPAAHAIPTSTVGSWTRTQNASNFGYSFFNADGAQNREVVYSVFLGVGTWTIGIAALKGNTRGIAHIALDGVEKGTIDLYAGGDSRAVGEITGILVTVPKLYAVRIRMATKNVSSSAYNAYLNGVYFIRTGGSVDVVQSSDYPNGTWWAPTWINFARKTWGSAFDNTGTAIMGAFRASGTQNEYAEWDIYLMPGTYKIAVWYEKNSGHGILTIKLDGVTIGTVDMYNASVLENQFTELTGIAVAAPKLMTFRMENPTKNASSSGYAVKPYLVAMVKT